MKLQLDSKSRLLLVFLLATIFGALLFGILGNLSALLFLNINVFSSNFDVETLSQSEQISLFRLTQPFSTVGIFLFSPLVTQFIFAKNDLSSFSEYRISYSSILSASVLILMVKPIVGWLSVVNNKFDFSLLGDFGETLVEASRILTEKVALVAMSYSVPELMLNILIIALIPAIAEEFFFRGFIQRYLTRLTKNYHISVWVTALAFGLIHFNVVSLLPLVFLGAILGYIYHYSQNIWTSILAHFINNASLLWFVYKYSFDTENIGEESVSTQSLVFSIVMTFALLFFMYTAWDHRKHHNA